MLARSHGYSGGNWSTHNYYHADGNGNVTYLVNSSQGLAASYKYDPYGNLITQSGGLASANVYRFSSKMFYDMGNGPRLYYYGYRFYDLYMQRWLSRDPLDEAGGINLYRFVENNPTAQIDPDGLTCRSNLKFFWDWVTGGGSNNRGYGDGSTESEEMKNSPGAQAMRDKFYNEGCKNFDRGTYDTYTAAWETVFRPSTAKWGSTALQVGGFARASATYNGDGTATFCIPNVAGMKSFSWFHILPNMPDRIHLPVVGTFNCPMRNIKQTICWTEKIDTTKCRCPAPNRFERQLIP